MRLWVAALGVLALCALGCLAGPAEAQVQQIGDEYMLEATVEATDGAGASILTAVCHTRVGQQAAAAQTGQITGALADGTPVTVAVAIPACQLLLVQQEHWMVDGQMEAHVRLGEGESQRKLGWSHKGAQTLPMDRKAQVGSVELSLAEGKALRAQISLAVVRLGEATL